GNVLLAGGDGNDVIHNMNWLPSAATIYGDGGDDLIYGGSGSTTYLYGGGGDDHIIASAGATIYGDAGNDVLEAGAGVNNLYGGD
ncbi:calcium-binding protein, partial [Lactiplantibacillus plantarum]|uniref:calcium-binding protein n=1 Tax=Lactiplantibacillus plantarum TaxID=1590 RepID=UPI00385341E0